MLLQLALKSLTSDIPSCSVVDLRGRQLDLVHFPSQFEESRLNCLKNILNFDDHQLPGFELQFGVDVGMTFTDPFPNPHKYPIIICT